MLTIVLTRKSNAQLGGSHFGFTFPLYRVGKYIFKQGDRSDMNSYRLISLISAIAKVFERIVYNQLSSYLSKNNILSKYQSGFRSFHSTVTALLEATDNWAFNIDRGYVIAVVFLDLKKHLTQSITLFYYPNYIHMESKELPTNCFLQGTFKAPAGLLLWLSQTLRMTITLLNQRSLLLLQR